MADAGSVMLNRNGFGSAGGGTEAHRFLSGADMDPTAILAAYPGAQFVARARLGVGPDDGDGGWGIVIRVVPSVDAHADGDDREVVTDDGRRFRAIVVNGGRPAGEPGAVLAAARYWELPPSYVRRLPDAGEVD